MKRLRVIFWIAALVLAAPVAAQSPSSPKCRWINSGLIVNFLGRTDGYELLRGGRRITLAFFSELQGGDVLRVVARAGRLVVEEPSGSTFAVSAADGRLCVRRSSRPSKRDNFLRSIGELLTRRRDEPADDLVSRGGDPLQLAPADLAAGTALVTASVRTLAFAWNGGRAPFQVRMIAPDGAVLVAEHGIGKRLLRLSKPQSIAPGRYRVIVSDANGVEVSGAFRSIADGSSIASSESPDSAIARSAKLLAEGENRSFDAFLVLSRYRGDSGTPAELMDVLALPH